MVPEPRGVRESMVGWGAEAARPRHLDARVRGQDDQLSSTVPLSSSCKGRRIHPHDFLQTPSSVKGVALRRRSGTDPVAAVVVIHSALRV
jgi:hypothetical protein